MIATFIIVMGVGAVVYVITVEVLWKTNEQLKDMTAVRDDLRQQRDELARTREEMEKLANRYNTKAATRLDRMITLDKERTLLRDRLCKSAKAVKSQQSRIDKYIRLNQRLLEEERDGKYSKVLTELIAEYASGDDPEENETE